MGNLDSLVIVQCYIPSYLDLPENSVEPPTVELDKNNQVKLEYVTLECKLMNSGN